ncbi:MAG: hypothetical protein QOJ92_2115 [Frankiales bacterium]|nr:hypothetical protein [Frankiales bacterium]
MWKYPQMRVRPTWVIVVAACVVTAIAFPAAGSRRISTTTIRVVSPITATGLTVGYRVVETVDGDCFASSDVLAGRIYRCSSGNYLSDPCWLDPRFSAHDHVVCLAAPWEHDLTAIAVKKPLAVDAGDGSTIAPAYPWGITLSGGRRCIALQGAHDHIVDPKQGERVIDYDCASSHTSLLRGLHESQQPWTIEAINYRPSPFAYLQHTKATRSIAVAWYGSDGTVGAESSLPYTGLPIWWLLASGLAMIAAGQCCNRVGRVRLPFPALASAD